MRLGKDTVRHEIVSNNLDIDLRFYLSEDEGSYVTPHWHNSLEIVYMVNGSMRVNAENKIIDLFENQFVVVNSRTVHAVKSKKNKAVVLQIPMNFLEKYVSGIDGLQFFLPDQSINDVHLDKLKRIFFEMYQIYYKRQQGYLLKFYSLLYEVLYILVTFYSKKIGVEVVARTTKHLAFLKEITIYLHEQHANKISVRDVGVKFGYHPDYISRFFKKYMGITILEYLYAIRSDYVYKDILTTDFSIGHIFECHGCTNYRVSMRMFKNQYGCTPKEKRKQVEKLKES